MKIRLLTIAHKPPAWLQEGYEEYAKRLPPTCALQLIEIAPDKQLHSADLTKKLKREGEKMLAAIKPQHHIIALDVQGKLFSTEDLATEMANWLGKGRNIDLLIGGADGLAPECLKIANDKWSLSTLTFPHTLVRLIVAEQIYRAYSLLQHHPYHR